MPKSKIQTNNQNAKGLSSKFTNNIQIHIHALLQSKQGNSPILETLE